MNVLKPISSIMSSNLITLNPEDKMEAAKAIFAKNNIHHIPVVNFRSIVGMISKSDFLSFSHGFSHSEDRLIENIRFKNWKVAEIMTTGLAKLDVNDPIRTAIDIFKMNQFHALPVLENDELVGIVTTQDIINQLANEKTSLEDYQTINS